MRVIWIPSGCVVFADDGTRMPFTGHRYTREEITGKSKAQVAKLPGALWKRFSL